MISIRASLAARLLAIFVLLFGLTDVLIYVTIDRFLDSNMDASLVAKAKARSSLVSQGAIQLDVDWRGLADQLSQGANPDLVQIQDEKGHLLGGDKSLPITPPVLKGETIHWNLKLASGKTYRAIAMRFIPHPDEDQLTAIGNKVAPPCILIVATDRADLDETQRHLGAILVGVTVIALLVSSILIFWGVTRGLRPLRDFGSSVSRIDSTTLGERLGAEALPPEIQPIAEKLNDLLSRLEVSFARERRFSADVSHELRTPIAEIRTISEVMLKDPSLSDDIREAFKDVLDSSCQMEALVAALLEIVRVERAGSALEVRRTDLCAMIVKAWKRHKKRAEEKGLTTNLRMPDELWIETDQRLLALVLNNLFSNAAEYTPIGGWIGADVQSKDNRFIITIQNSTEDLKGEDLAHFFERFWRKDKVRQCSEHFGLGLSVTQLLCQRLRIHLTVSMPRKDVVSFWLSGEAAPELGGENRLTAIAQTLRFRKEDR